MTRLCRWPLRIAATFLLAVALPMAAQAQAARAPVIGVIDIQVVLRESVAVKALAERIEAGRQSAQQAMLDREELLRAADFDLAQRRASLSEDEYLRERENLETEGVTLQREMQAERRRLDQLFSRGMSEVQQVLLLISQEIARERNLDLVLAKTTVIIVKSEFDFTDEALNRLNARLVDVSLPTTGN
ncbi:OmpH family outer membrane protein [Pelagibius litoralis]|uniref:OmpH family outer membrane protein n=1 Tax=Pelagibius litoralis TaxID=374515 RepID=A0A967C670_9PROT|nr:OmpH family outer membrane protein [Pelagibius litoralis]NIA67302.1 OmpH family outer membrane protein [Pelagibius litoralis]